MTQRYFSGGALSSLNCNRGFSVYLLYDVSLPNEVSKASINLRLLDCRNEVVLELEIPRSCGPIRVVSCSPSKPESLNIDLTRLQKCSVNLLLTGKNSYSVFVNDQLLMTGKISRPITELVKAECEIPCKIGFIETESAKSESWILDRSLATSQPRLMWFREEHEGQVYEFSDGTRMIEGASSFEDTIFERKCRIIDFPEIAQLFVRASATEGWTKVSWLGDKNIIESDGFMIAKTCSSDDSTEIILKSKAKDELVPARLSYPLQVSGDENERRQLRFVVPVTYLMLRLIDGHQAYAGTTSLHINRRCVGSFIFDEGTLASYSIFAQWAMSVWSEDLPFVKLAMVDLASLLNSTGCSAHIQAVCPELHSVLSSYLLQQGLSGLIAAPSGDAETLAGTVATEKSCEKTTALGAALRAAAQCLALGKDSEPSVDQILDWTSGLSGVDAFWFAANFISFETPDRLIPELRKLIDSTYLWSLATAPATRWTASTLVGMFALTQEFGVGLAILEALEDGIDQDTSGHNMDAIAFALKLLCQTESSKPFRRPFFDAVVQLLKRTQSREGTCFRHAGLFRSLCEYLVTSAFLDGSEHDEAKVFLHGFFESVREFWLILHERVGELECGEVKAELERFCNTDERLQRLLLLSKGLEISIAGSSVPSIEISAFGAREEYLQRLVAMKLRKPDWNGEADKTELIDFGIRLMALPQDVLNPAIADLLDPSTMRTYLQQRQNYPVNANQALLTELGKVLLSGNQISSSETMHNFLQGGFPCVRDIEDHFCDVATWMLIKEKLDNRDTSRRLVELLHARLQASQKPFDLSASIWSALTRILKFSRHLDIANDEVKLLEREYSRILSHFPGAHEDMALDRWKKSCIGSSFFSDTLIAIVTCKENLSTRASCSARTWVRQAHDLGVQLCFFYGAGLNGELSVDHQLIGSPVIALPVEDTYEDLPSKIIAMFDWILRNTSAQYIVKIDDDCLLDPEFYLGGMNYRHGHYFGRSLLAGVDSFNRSWHHDKVNKPTNALVLDTSLPGTLYADGGGAYSVSRLAAMAICQTADSVVGERMRLSSFYEDKLVGDFLSLYGVRLSSTGYSSVQLRRNFRLGSPTLQIDKGFFPSIYSGTSVAHLDVKFHEMEKILNERACPKLSPSRLFPLSERISLSSDSCMLELLGAPDVFARAKSASSICVSVIRNEITILPHFLAHYRGLGVDLFFVVDNLSSDGSREFLQSQDDVVVFSASSDYRDANFGVDWQRIILDHFCIGRWVVIADADEFLITEGKAPMPLAEQCMALERLGYNAASVFMIDMYTKSDLATARFDLFSPLSVARCFDSKPVIPWPFNRGPFGNYPSVVSALRHRLVPGSAPQMYTSQKFALLKYDPLASFSQGLHFCAGYRISPSPLAFLHFKYSSDFFRRAGVEVKRQQHFDNASEYKGYCAIGEEFRRTFWLDGVSSEIEEGMPFPLEYILRKC